MSVIIPISQLPAATTLDGTELIPIVQGNITKKATAAQVQASPEVANIIGGTIDNTIIGATTPSAASFTTVTAPNVIGGSAVGSSLELRSTSGVGTTDFIKFTVGNNGATEAARIAHSANFLIGTTTDTVSTYPLQIQRDQNQVTGIRLRNATAGTLACAQIDVLNNTNKLMSIGINSTGYTTSGQFVADQGWLYTNATAGMLISTSSVSAPIVFNQQTTERMRISPTNGNLLIGTTTDDGTNKLQVSGGALLSGSTRINSNIGIAVVPTTGYNIRNALALTGGVSTYGMLTETQINSDVTSSANLYMSFPTTQAAAFTLTSLRHFYASQSTIGAGSAVTSQYGFHAESTLTGATNNYGFYGNIASGTGRYNLYMAGTADNYIAGNLGVGVTPTARNNTHLQISDGLGFPATQVASSDANTLDDYEEGTFTPTIVGTTTAGTGTYSVQGGRYTKIGQRVFFTALCAITAHTGTGNMKIAGLPFTVQNVNANDGPCAVWVSNLTFAGQIQAYPDKAGTTVSLENVLTGAASAAIAMDTACSVELSGSYDI